MNKNWPPEPPFCACNNSGIPSPFHCPECGRWKPSTAAMCDHCTVGAWKDELREYFSEKDGESRVA